MLIIQGYYFNGQNAKRVNATLKSISDSELSLVFDDSPLTPALLLEHRDIHIEAPLGKTPREVNLGEERLFITEDNDAIEQLSRLTRKSTSPFSLIHRLEKSLIAALLFSVLAVVFSWLIIVYGIPKAAKSIAFELPEYIESQLATSLDVLDHTLLEPSELPIKRQTHLRSVFAQYIKAHEELDPKIHFRSGIGANALALPNGDIVFTDDLVNLVSNDQELVAVLFHELGHLKNKHFTRRLLQGSMISLAVIVLTGDLDTFDIITGIPTLVVDLAYSREFELEADRYAIDRLKASGLPVESFSIMIKHLAEHYDEEALHHEPSKINVFLSTHPHPQERIRQAEQY